MQSLAKFTYASAHYRPREGMVAFVLHRISGLAVLLFLSIHIVDTSTVYFFPDFYEEFLAVYCSIWSSPRPGRSNASDSPSA